MRILELAKLLDSGKISAVELTELYLAAIHRNESLGALITVTDEKALRDARDSDDRRGKGEARGIFDGIPCVIKDNIVTAGIRTTCASHMLENYVPFYDAFVWKKLSQAGAVLLGKANMDEFAMGSTTETSAFGAAKNPVNEDYVPGGSSGGSAAAVAAGLSPFALGSDTGGSIRQPASFCGISGLKPTYGRVSRNGLIAYGSSLDQIGPLCRYAEDLAPVFSVICGHDPDDMSSLQTPARDWAPLRSLSGVTIGILDELFEGCSEDVLREITKAVEQLRSFGAEVKKIEIPMLRYSLPAYYIIACAEAASNLNRYDGIRYGAPVEAYQSVGDMIRRTRSERFGKEVQRRIMLGNYVLSAGYFDAYYRKAQKVRSILKRQFAEALETVDFIASPVAPVTALRFGAEMTPVEMYQTDICTVPVNLTGLPAVSVPCGFGGNRLPVGLQLIGASCRDEELIQLAELYERSTEYESVRSEKMGADVLGADL